MGERQDPVGAFETQRCQLAVTSRGAGLAFERVDLLVEPLDVGEKRRDSLHGSLAIAHAT